VNSTELLPEQNIKNIDTTGAINGQLNGIVNGSDASVDMASGPVSNAAGIQNGPLAHNGGIKQEEPAVKYENGGDESKKPKKTPTKRISSKPASKLVPSAVQPPHPNLQSNLFFVAGKENIVQLAKWINCQYPVSQKTPAWVKYLETYAAILDE
jgi:hypothetical protein